MTSRTTEPVRHRRIARRPFLKAVGAAVVVASAGGVGAAQAADRRGAAADESADALIIGAGYAGVTVARELSARGLKPLILEARNRTGGRIWTDTFSGEQVEIGGGWVGEQQVLVQRELTRYGITTTPDIGPDRMLLPGDSGLESMTPAEAVGALSPLWTEFYRGSETYFERPYEPLHRKDLLANVDGMSLADRLRQLSLSPKEFHRLNSETSLYSGGPSSIGALTGMAQWFQLSGGDYESSLSMNQKPAGGMISLLKAMLRESGAQVRLQSAVTRITESRGVVTVEVSSGKRYTAPMVVVATPTNVWKDITFQPGLPPAHATATRQGIGVPHSNKLWIHVQGRTEALFAQTPEGSPISMMLPQQQLADGRLMVAFAGPSLDAGDPAAVQEAVRELLPGSSLIRYRTMDWGRDRYARGGWGLRRPGQLLALFPQIEEPHGRILFAGADIAQGWHGAYVEGAIESGLRAARQAVALVR
ncbi:MULTISPECIES: flavin monoamine oxidase family protein [Streptomyces]|uniref:NAD(P)/FAD-dependent oxidoreductase n=1 Tax=Streptomyces caniscabiei TaxID=2746961 RepID=A0ABU4N386_9ACTN|nr:MULTISPECIES: NAD(P)/FAD-dependent oxidoreductase [Streptomyces]MDX2941564.1 NAD(P)/FAD-dependent oxidoreductase [Streptomyces caniscabiei]MDX2957511.1 NAD(P)/FAD-dependent oxidoreductase [Streptomyces caniscabiei]MDX2990265.1 NAD(P)/FAD-dependent oxidoreductase [Streptomyces caniscabiei]MDX3015597.1 NAD(P)/FAD-dependent oxidoreductase [Streptomyces caniscabiei]MDX3043317.1 NAD(P)/FAD-dependent oxidoreductase [Streptomyces caniscabiei]